VSLNAACRVEAYWNAHHIPLRLYRLNALYSRQLGRLGHNVHDVLNSPEFLARVHIIELNTAHRLLIPRTTWDTLSLEARLEFTERYTSKKKDRKNTARSIRTARRVAMEPTVRDYSFLPVTDVVERPSIDELIRARRRNG
jgi:hypothetical protein